MGTLKKDSNTVNSKNAVDAYGRVILTLKNCLLPEEKLSPTPTQLDGLDIDTELDLRILGCELIQTAGILLKLPQVAMATAQVLFQRFYYSKSFVRQNYEVTGMGCLYLASKIEEAPRRIRDVINVYHHIKQFNNQKTLSPMLLDQNYISLKYQVIKAERRVLKELGFCVHVKHPHKLIVLYLQVIGLERNTQLMQLAWNYMNDSLRTDVFVRYQPETIACACIYLTARKLKVAMPKSPPWHAVFKVDEKDIQDVCTRILRLYSRPKPKVDQLEKKVQELCKKFEENRQKKSGFLNIASGNNTPNSPNTSEKKTSPKRRSHSDRSRSRSVSSSPRHKKSKKYKRSISRSRSRSRSYDRKYKKSSKNSRRSRSSSPSNKRYKDKIRYRSRSRSYDRDIEYYKSSDKYKDRRRSEERYSKKIDKHYSSRERDEDEDYKKKSSKDTKYDKNNKDDRYTSKDKHKISKYKDEDDEDYISKKDKHNNIDRRKRNKHRSDDDEEEEIEIISIKRDKRSR